MTSPQSRAEEALAAYYRANPSIRPVRDGERIRVTRDLGAPGSAKDRLHEIIKLSPEGLALLDLTILSMRRTR